MTTNRDEMFRMAAEALAEWSLGALDVGDRFLLSSPDGPLPAAFHGEGSSVVMALLRELEAAMPLERLPGEGVWETLAVSRGLPHTWVSIVNAIGERERVTTIGVAEDGISNLEDWCRCREQSTVEDTTWDEARRHRRVVDWRCEAMLIDRGANRIIDIVESFGATPVESCEGHPGGAYVEWADGDIDTIVEHFEEAGWSTERVPGGAIAYMPTPNSVEDRDACWRATCAILEAKLAAAPLP